MPRQAEPPRLVSHPNRRTWPGPEGGEGTASLVTAEVYLDGEPIGAVTGALKPNSTVREWIPDLIGTPIKQRGTTRFQGEAVSLSRPEPMGRLGPRMFTQFHGLRAPLRRRHDASIVHGPIRHRDRYIYDSNLGIADSRSCQRPSRADYVNSFCPGMRIILGPICRLCCLFPGGRLNQSSAYGRTMPSPP